VAASDHLGAPTERLLEESGVPCALRAAPAASVPEHDVWRFLGNCARNAGHPTFGLLAGMHSPLPSIGPLGNELEQALTLHEALATFCRKVNSYSSHAHYWRRRAKGTVWFCWQSNVGSGEGARQVEQYVVALMIQIIRVAGGSAWGPPVVRLQMDAMRDLRRFESLQDSDFVFGQPFTGLPCPTLLLSLPVPRSAEQSAEVTDEGIPTLDSLRAQVAAALGSGLPLLQVAAEQTGTPVRTLQRRLASRGLTWSRLIDQVRLDAAVSWLRDTGASLREIAHQVGYSDQAHFTRAFERWTGLSPRAWRRLHVPGTDRS
jgi:AraC-like DNA-binding protein